MAANDSLTSFVHEALAAGRSRDEIREALANAGWSGREIAGALDGFAATEFLPPVPRPRPHLTARDTFLYLLLFTSMAFVAIYLVILIHAILDLALPDPGDLSYRERWATERIRWSIAMLIVAAPVFAWMTIYTGRAPADDTGQRRSLVRKWLTYLALFVSALVFCGDAAYVIYSFLTGEITLRFILKALTVACVAGGIFAFYLRDVEAAGDEE